MDKISLLQKTLRGAKPISSTSSPSGRRRYDSDEFISRVNGAKTCWPALMLASAVIAGGFVLLISLALSSGAG